MLPLEIDVQEVKRRLDAGEMLHLIDVREPEEFAIAHIDGGELVRCEASPVRSKSSRRSRMKRL